MTITTPGKTSAEQIRRTRRRFLFSPNTAPNIGDSVPLDKEESKHAASVLRLEIGEEVILFDNINISEYLGKIDSVTKDLVTVEVTEQMPINLSASKTHALIGLPNFKVCEIIVEKLTELGTSEIIFFIADRTEIKILSETKFNRLLKIKDSALKQSRSLVSTKLRLEKNLQEALLSFENIDNISKIIFTPDLNSSKITDLTLKTDKLAVIGPENGFSAEEEQLLKINDFCFVNLGSNILRVETAGILGVGLLQAYGRKSS